MAKFIYRMQNVLNIKYKLEEQAKQEYTEARIRFNEEEAKLQLLEQRQAEYMNQYRNLVSTRLYILEIEQCKNALFIIDEYILNQKLILSKAKDDLDIATEKLQDSMKERKIHEKLKEKEFDKFLQELNEEEAKEIDQVVSYQYNKNAEEEN